MRGTLSNAFSITEKIIEISNPKNFKWDDIYISIEKQINLKNRYIIKLNLVKTTTTKLYFHVVYIKDFIGFIDKPFMPNVRIGFKPTLTTDVNDVCCLIIPTGVGAKYGGYAGDANPIATLIANKSSYLLTHPNVVNGAVLSDLPKNIIYLEGFLLDQFLLGKIKLTPTRKNKIGVIFDKSIKEEKLNYEINVLNATKSFYGCEIIGYSVTEKPLSVQPALNDYGFSSGEIANLDYLIRSAFKLKEKGATALALCTQIEDLKLNKEYISGKGIDPIGGLEAVISHAISAATGLVSAHAPIFKNSEEINFDNVAPIAAAEYIAPTFLPSVISGLRFAPIIREQKPETKDQEEFSTLGFEHLNKVIVPYNAFGSSGVFVANEIFKNVILVKENTTCLDIAPEHLNCNFNFAETYRDLFDENLSWF